MFAAADRLPSALPRKEALTQHRQGEPVERLAAVVGTAEVLALQQKVRQVRFEDRLQDYLLEIRRGDADTPGRCCLGASIRAGLGLYRAASLGLA